MNSTEIITLHKYSNSGFSKDLSYQIVSYTSTVIRDIFSTIMEVTINIVIVISLHRFYQKKLALGLTNDQAKSSIKKNERSKMKLAFINSTLSIITHLFSFFVFMFLKYGYQHPFVLYLGHISILVNTFRHSLNFFLFYMFNSKFKQQAGCKLVINCGQSQAQPKRRSISNNSDEYDLQDSKDFNSRKNGVELISVERIHHDNYATSL